MTSRLSSGLRMLQTVLYMRVRGVQVGPLPVCRGRMPILSGTIRIGRNFRTRSAQSLIELSSGPNGALIIGDDVFINQGANIHAAHCVRIGDRVRIADNVTVYDTDFHPVSPGPVRVEPVTIEDGAWLGRSAIVLPGVTIGEHSVIAAGAVVAHDVPARTVAAGNPARVVKHFACPDGWVRP